MLFRILGPVGVGSDPADLTSFAGPKVRALLAALLVHANQWVSKRRLVGYIWPSPPSSAEPNLRGYATNLRRALEASSPGLGVRLEARRGGGGGDLRLRASRPEVDSWSFLHLAEYGSNVLRHGSAGEAAEALTAALGLWRGRPGADLPDTASFRDDFVVLNRWRHQAELDLCHARIRLGEADTAILPLRQLADEDELAERPVRLLMQALDQVAEPAAALGVYHDYRSWLADQTGADPSRELQELYLKIVRSADISSSRLPT